MTDSRAVRFPDDAEMREAFERYAMAVGGVAYIWNRLHETLGELFAAMIGGEREPAMSAWYSIRSDYSQRRMLEAVTKARTSWPPYFDLQSEILWVVRQADNLAEERNNAIHAPAVLYVGANEAKNAEMGAFFMNGNPRAKKLTGKNLLKEFKRCEEWTEALQSYATAVMAAGTFPAQIGLPTRPARPIADE